MSSILTLQVPQQQEGEDDDDETHVEDDQADFPPASGPVGTFPIVRFALGQGTLMESEQRVLVRVNNKWGRAGMRVV